MLFTPKLTPAEVAELVRRGREGESAKSLGVAFHISHDTASTHLYRAGVIPRYIKRRTP
jgi:DNA-binding CsgD family transcriptional regulator